MSDTPAYDETAKAAQPQTDAPDATKAAEPQQLQLHFDDEDVPALLARTTADGPGFSSEDELPESDTTFDAEEEIK